MANENLMRRTPQQVRGQRRVSQILDAAAEVFAETGYETATTNAIAIRANTSIGSLYQFFPNKQAILNALATRYRGQLDSLLEDVFVDDTAPLQAVLITLIDRIAEFYTANPAFRAMFYSAQSSTALTDVADEICRQITQRVNRRFASVAATLAPELCEFYATVIVVMMRAMIPFGAAGDDAQEARFIAELKRMVFAYLMSIEPFRGQRFSFDQ